MKMATVKAQSVSVKDFAMIPRADIPRAQFRMQRNLKTTHPASFLIPIMVEEVLPGDSFNVNVTIVARTATPIVPVMDNWHYETFYFFVPNRLVWSNWVRFMGEQPNPGDSISFTIPTVQSPTGGWPVCGIGDYMGLPIVGQVLGGSSIITSALPFRAYNLIWRDWFRDENLQNSTSFPVQTGDGPDAPGTYALALRGKRKDYFTGALPFLQKGTAVTIPLGTTAPVRTNVGALVSGAQQPMTFKTVAGGATANQLMGVNGAGGPATLNALAVGAWGNQVYPDNLFADLTAATSATINQLRQSVQIQKLLERDARGGTRYTEIVRSHFGVVSPDARLQRPEYLGGGSTMIVTNAIPQTSATGLTGGSTPAGSLAATGQMSDRHGFSYAATEHGYIIGLANVRADLTYDQGIRRHWSRSTRYDFYFPAFAFLGEQTILNREIYADGSGTDNNVFGYQERWAELRYSPSQITGLFRARATGNISFWHTAENFAAAPTLNGIVGDTTSATLARNFAAGALALNQQFLVDAFFDMKVARPIPMFSPPGMMDRF